MTSTAELEVAHEQAMMDALPILADVTHADVLYYAGTSPAQLLVRCHAQPHTTYSVYSENQTGETVSFGAEQPVAKSIRYGTRQQQLANVHGNGAAPVYQEVFPLRARRDVPMGAVSVEMSRADHDLFNKRVGVLQVVMRLLKEAVVRGEVRGAASLSPFTGRDGLVVVGRDMRIQYLSDIALRAYHDLQVTPRLKGEIDLLETGDEQLIAQAFHERVCLEREEPVRDAIWLRRVIPIPAGANAEPRMVLLLIRDVTQDRFREQEHARLETMNREIHHRVKNNLQTLVSLARMDARRAQASETKRTLEEFSNRIFAIAQVHESLSMEREAAVPIKDVCRQIAQHVRQTMLPPDSRIEVVVEGDAFSLLPKQATACALIVNELVQNAFEHAFRPGDDGLILVQLEDTPERLRIAVVDNGCGLPDGFDWRKTDNLGLKKIVSMLTPDLRGEFSLSNLPSPARGAVAQITIPRTQPGGT